MTSLIFSAVTSFTIAFLTLPVIIRYSASKNLVDIPGRRKIHKRVTPTMGGIAIFIGFIISLIIWINSSDLKTLRYFIISLLVIFFVGVRDDLMSLRPTTKLAAQVFIALILVIYFDLRFHSLFGLFGIHSIPEYVSYALSVLTIVVIVNSFNLIDGLDGLAGTIGSITLITYGIWFHLAGDSLYSLISFSMLGGMLAFLIFNWEPTEIFMGDSGALVVGLLLAIITIHFIEFNYSLPANHLYRYEGSVGTGICFVAVPLIDTLRILIIRILRRQSPFTPDKGHVHHTITRLGLSHSETTLVLVGAQALFIVLSIIFRQTNDHYLILGAITLGAILVLILHRAIHSRVNV